VRGRRGRLTAQQQRALQDSASLILPVEPLDIAAEWGDLRPVITDIGFGSGESTVELARRFPEHAIIAIDVHPPGIARLLEAIEQHHLHNIRIMMGNALDMFEYAFADVTVDHIFTLFPDPWPKARHHKRRLLQSSAVDELTRRTSPTATWHIATDWEPYAEHISEVFANHPLWIGGAIERPERVLTKYEQRGLAAGRAVTDFVFTRLSAPMRSLTTRDCDPVLR
jgi:tRNA (guanine-N7-)-methyltransferase